MLPDDGGPAEAGAPVASVRTRCIVETAKLLSVKGRREQGKFLADGPQAVGEALSKGVVTRVFVAESALDRLRGLIDRALDATADVVVCDYPALAKVSGAQNPQGIVAVAAIPEVSFAPASGRTKLVIGLDRVSDPGNVGTIIRTAAAAGADAVVLSRDCVDPFNDKCVRSSTGSIFHIPVLTDVDLAEFSRQCSAIGMGVIAGDANGEPLDSPGIDGVLRKPALWLFGSEAHGLAGEVRATADRIVAVPHYGTAESLNVASAAAVCLYASAMALHRSEA